MGAANSRLLGFPGSQFSIYGGHFVWANTFNMIQTTDRKGFKHLQRWVATSALHDSFQHAEPPRCHPKTREAILQQIFDWMASSEERKEWLMWLNGAAGAGKSAIARSTMERCVTTHRAAISFFFCERDLTRNTLDAFVATLAYQLLQVIPDTSKDIIQVIERNPLIFQQSFESQIKELFIDPLVRVWPLFPELLLLIVLDGLDECKNKGLQCELIQVLGNLMSTRKVPAIFLIASRREAHIEATFKQQEVANILLTLPLDDVAKVSDDIRRFLESKFAALRETHKVGPDLPDDWPAPRSIDDIIKKSSRQFLYASLVMNYIGSPYHHPVLQLQIIEGLRLQHSSSEHPLAHLDILYHHIFSKVKALYYENIFNILAYILLTGENRISVINQVFQFELGELEMTLSDLAAVIACDRQENSIQLLHLSLSDFLLDENRSVNYHIRSDEHSAKLACLILARPSKHYFGDSNILKSLVQLLRKATSTAQLWHLLLQFTPAVELMHLAFGSSLLPMLDLLEATRKLSTQERNEVYHHFLALFNHYLAYRAHIDSDEQSDAQRICVDSNEEIDRMHSSELYMTNRHIQFTLARQKGLVQAAVNHAGRLAHKIIGYDKSTSKLFGLIIGINKYKPHAYRRSHQQHSFEPEPPSFPNLRGAVADAENFYKYLTSDLGVPSGQINLLCDEQATRAEIIKAFQDLGERQDIRKGDSIVIFYAGHGAQALPPQRLSATPGCPKYVELLVPHDYGKDPKNYQSKGIPDYTLATLLNGIAEKKGDKITVIFDSCHSASAQRGPVSKPVSDDKNSQPIARTGPALNYRIPDDLDVDIWGGKRALSVLPRLRHVGSASYVFFSACSSSELAKEDNGRGYFTSALLKLLKEVGSRTLPCSQIITRIGKIPDQSPQCEGLHTTRSIFHDFSPSYRKRFYNVSIRHLRYTVDAGMLDGLSQGDELTIYKTQSEDALQKPVAVFVVDKVSNRNSLLRVRDQPPLPDLESYLVDPAPALLTKTAQPHLRLYISAGRPNHVERLVSLVNRSQTAGTIAILTSEADRPKAHICLSTNDGVDLLFDVVDGDLTKDHCHRFKYKGDNGAEGLTEILRRLSDYYWHLTRTLQSSSLDIDISISFCELRQDNKNSALFVSNGQATELLVRDGDVMELDVDSASDANSQEMDIFDDDPVDSKLYGVKIANNSQWDLYPALFYFDNRDFTITPIYQPPLGSLGNRNAESPLKKRESITIGYGAAGAGAAVPPLYFSVPKGRKMDTGFLKLILSTEHIDLDDMVQPSPLFGGRTGRTVPSLVPRKRQLPLVNLSSFTIKVIKRLRKDS